MQFSVNTYSFSQLLAAGTTQVELIHKAKEIGFDSIEFVGILPHDNSSKTDYAKLLKKTCDDIGLSISNYTFGSDFINGSNGDTELEVQKVKEEIDIAAVLGASSVRHDVTQGSKTHFKSFYSNLSLLADVCRKITLYAKQKGISTMVENHGTYVQDSDRVEALLNEVDDENFGLLLDIGNFLCVDEPPEKAVGKLAKYARYVHAKDFLFKSGNDTYPGDSFFSTRGGNYLRGTVLGHGTVPVKQCLSILKNSGFDGTIAIEFEGTEPSALALELGLSNLKRYVSEI